MRKIIFVIALSASSVVNAAPVHNVVGDPIGDIIRNNNNTKHYVQPTDVLYAQKAAAKALLAVADVKKALGNNNF